MVKKHVRCPQCEQQANILALCDCDQCIASPPTIYQPVCMGCRHRHYKRGMK